MSETTKDHATRDYFADEMTKALDSFSKPQPITEPTLAEFFDGLAINEPAGSSKEITHGQSHVEDQSTQFIEYTVHPPTLYRVQHERSFTHYDDTKGFKAKGSCSMHDSHWLVPSRVRKHLNWSDRSNELTPFISLFDNECESNFRSIVSFVYRY
jgi:hypothetical protein